MKKDIAYIGAIIGSLTQFPNGFANPTQIPSLPSSSPNLTLPNVAPQTSAAILTLLESGNLELLPNGQLIIREITFKDLKDLGIINEVIAKDSGWTPGAIARDTQPNPVSTGDDAGP